MNAAPATLMGAEMAEQPAVLARLAARFDQISEQVAGLYVGGVPGVAFVARGSSDHTALLGRYAVELYTGLPTCLVAPSLTTAYARRPSGFAGWLVIALSQSGRTPEIVSLAREFRAVGASVVAISNDGSSELARAAELAGPERMAVVGRGFCYPAALETALKLQETTGVMAHGFSTADFRHGP